MKYFIFWNLLIFTISDQKTLEEKIHKRQLEVERLDNRLKLLLTMKPPYMEEFERLEIDLERLYGNIVSF